MEIVYVSLPQVSCTICLPGAAGPDAAADPVKTASATTIAAEDEMMIRRIVPPCCCLWPLPPRPKPPSHSYKGQWAIRPRVETAVLVAQRDAGRLPNAERFRGSRPRQNLRQGELGPPHAHP